MSGASKRDYLLSIHQRYATASNADKTRILDEFCAVCGYHRKHAIRLLNAPVSAAEDSTSLPRPGRKPRYHTPEIRAVLQCLAVASNLVCSRRLKAMIPLWTPSYPEPLDENTTHLLCNISAATIDRLLADWRGRHRKIGLATTKPGSLVRKHIPIKTQQWDEARPGFLEADTVAHCGSSTAGSFVYTVHLVDIATGWSAFAACWGKGQTGVFSALRSIEQALPFAILGFDSDNGGEFINHHLLSYFTHRKRPVEYTRSRPYQANDNAHIEQKNWSTIRQYLGYHRFEDQRIVALLNDLYANELSLLINFFLPSFKLLDKHRQAGKLIKHHDPPKTPYQRPIDSQTLSGARRGQLQQLRDSLNPFDLQEAVKRKLLAILSLASNPSVPQPF